MKNNILFLILFITSCISLFAQNNPSLAPLNPDFVKFIAKLNSGKAPQPGSDEFGTHDGPPPGQVNFESYLKNSKLKSTNFAAIYDMRTTGLLTPVKGQTGGACWAFATMASVESRWLTLGLGTWDLSDNNLKYCHGFVPERNTWGNHWMSTAYFARRSGPLVETDDPNAASSTCPTGKTPVGYITDSRYLPHDMNIIKQAILDYGAIYTMMYIDLDPIKNYYNPSDYTYYYNGTPQVNHAVDLVGWDDTKATAGGTGAWICKNSYGPGWGQAGYFYISYNDKSVLDYNAYWPVRIENVPATQVYGYDDLGNYNAIVYAGHVGYILVKFVATGSQILSKVGTYALSSDEIIDIDVFDNFNETGNSLTGLLSHQGGLSCPLPGYYTFDLAKAVVINPGNDFYIRIRYQTQGTAPQIPIEYKIAGYSVPSIESHVAWITSDTIVWPWTLIGGSTDWQWDPCVKVYAEPVPVLLTWNGSASTDWNNAGNWSPALVPDGAKDVLIRDVAVKPVITQSPATPAVCKNLSVDAGSSLTIAAGKALTVYGTLTNNAGTKGLVIETGASLITKGTVNGQATVNSEINQGEWHFISSPVSDASAGIFSGKYLQKFNEFTNAYTDITAASDPLIPFTGYALWGNDNGFTAQYKGDINTGNQSVALTRTANGINSGWNLVGNPYPSSINWNASGWTKTNLNNTIYIENAGGWATYINGAGTNGGSPFIAPGQGFMVNVAGVGTGALAMNNFVRAHNATAFLKSSGADSLVRIKVSGNGYSDEAIVRFMTEATDEFDGEYDALKLFGYIKESAQIYTLGRLPLTINSILPDSKVVTLGLHAGTSGKYALAATQISNVDSVLLEDLKTGIFTNLSVNPYSFTFETGENEERFRLHFATSTYTGLEKPQSAVATVFSNNQTVFITLKEQLTADIRVYTVAGQLVAYRLSARGSISLSLPCTGIYIVRIVTEDNTVVEKIWVN